MCDRFQTYFPHVDNVYSHRSTQRHKRKRFVSHYWDCRLKGRPPGTKKSTDPEKKKRKRVARERDLCDVKIKITEYFDGAELLEQTGQQPPGDTITSPLEAASGNQFFGQSGVGAGGWGMQGMTGAGGVNVGMAMGLREQKKFYTIQRVNGNGGNGKGDGVAGPHKHTLEESDRVKKNSVQRWLMRNEKDRKRVQVRFLSCCSCVLIFVCSPRTFLCTFWCCTRLVIAARTPAEARDREHQSFAPRHFGVEHVPRVHAENAGSSCVPLLIIPWSHFVFDVVVSKSYFFSFSTIFVYFTPHLRTLLVSARISS